MTDLEKDVAAMIDEAIGTEPELIYKLLDHMAEAAGNTARHLEENWDDRVMARGWRKAQEILEKAAVKVESVVPV